MSAAVGLQTAARPRPRMVKLRPSVHFAPLEEGVFFRNWDKSFTIEGHRALYGLFERLLPHLEKGVDRWDLVGAVPPVARGAVELLLDRLEEHGMCLDPAQTADLSEREAEAFRPAISYLEGIAAEPYAAFERVRQARVAVMGSAGASFAAVRALATMGVGRLDCWASPADAPVIEQCLRGQPLVVGNVRSGPATLAGTAFSLVLHLEDGDAPFAALERIAASTLAPLLQAVIGTEAGAVGPLRRDGGPNLADTLARLRLPLGFDATGSTKSLVLTGLVGNLLAFEAFKFLAGIPSPTAEGRAAIVTREPLAISFHTVFPRARGAPRAPEMSAVRAALAEARTLATPVARDELVERIRHLADEVVGLIEVPHPEDLPQLPLFTCRARGGASEVLGFADNPTDAHVRAAMEALRALAAGEVRTTLVVLGIDGAGERCVPTAEMHLAAGTSYHAWLEDGIRGCLLRCFAGEHAPGLELATRQVGVDDVVGASARLGWKTLAVRYGKEVGALHAIVPNVPGLHLCAVQVDGESAGLSAGDTFADALDGAFTEAVARVQLQEAGIYLPARPPVSVAATAEPRATAWHADGRLERTLDALARCGLRVLVHPWCGEPALRSHGFLIGWVGIHVA